MELMYLVSLASAQDFGPYRGTSWGFAEPRFDSSFWARCYVSEPAPLSRHPSTASPAAVAPVVHRYVDGNHRHEATTPSWSASTKTRNNSLRWNGSRTASLLWGGQHQGNPTTLALAGHYYALYHTQPCDRGLTPRHNKLLQPLYIRRIEIKVQIWAQTRCWLGANSQKSGWSPFLGTTRHINNSQISYKSEWSQGLGSAGIDTVPWEQHTHFAVPYGWYDTWKKWFCWRTVHVRSVRWKRRCERNADQQLQDDIG
jgi:hypothetical protein